MTLNYHRQMVRRVLRKLGVGDTCIECAVAGNEGQDSPAGQTRTDFHFDGCDFSGGARYIEEQWQEVDRLIEAGCQKNICEIFEAWGRLTHAIQDFYAHSNWIELGNDDLWDLDAEKIPEGLCSGIWVLSAFVCRIEGKQCPTHAVLDHDDNDISKDEPGRPNFGRAVRLAYKHTRKFAGELIDKLGDDCLVACG